MAGIKKGGLNGGGSSQSPAHRKKVRSKKSKIEEENETRYLNLNQLIYPTYIIFFIYWVELEWKTPKKFESGNSRKSVSMLILQAFYHGYLDFFNN